MHTHAPWSRRSFGSGFLAGLTAGIVASGIMQLLHATLNGLSLPQEVGSQLLLLMPPSLFAWLHQIIGENAKYDFFWLCCKKKTDLLRWEGKKKKKRINHD